MSTSRVAVLGLGEMGRAIAARLLDTGHSVTVWNRSPGRADALIEAGAREASSFHGAVTSSRLLIVCVRDYESARPPLESGAGVLAGRAIVNLTTGTPGEARAMAEWAADNDITYLDGGIMAIPPMIGTPEAMLLYSGVQEVYESHRAALEALGSARYLGEDAGMAALQDLALLGAMYSMFAGAYQAYSMVGSAGVKAADFARPLEAWLQAMSGLVTDAASMIDAGDYGTDVQDLEFTRTALDTIIRASNEAKVGHDVLEPIRDMMQRQIDDGHGDEHFNRIIESLR